MVEWRIIDEFQDYEISDNGQVRNRETKEQKVVNMQNNTVLFAGKKRSVAKLIEKAFGEEPDEEWITLKDFPNFAISNKKRVKNIKTNTMLKIAKDNRVYLKDPEGKQKQKSVEILFKDYFSEKRDPNEVWLDIPGYDAKVSNTGFVKSLCKGKELIMKNQERNGYASVKISETVSRKRITTTVHYLVIAVFRPDTYIGEDDRIDHIDGNPLNCNLNNLEVVSHSENIRRAHANGLIKKREQPIYKVSLTGKDLEYYVSLKNVLRMSKGKYKEDDIRNALENNTEYKGFKWRYQKEKERYSTNLPGEKWKQIDDMDYDISNRARIKNRKTLQLLRTKTNKDDRECINLTRETFSAFIHDLVATAFVPNPENLIEVDHIDKNKTNNNAENLRWITSQGNKEHSFAGPVSQYNLDGTFIKNWISQTEAAEELDIPKPSISKCCSQQQNTAGKFIWKYLNIVSLRDEDDCESCE